MATSNSPKLCGCNDELYLDTSLKRLTKKETHNGSSTLGLHPQFFESPYYIHTTNIHYELLRLVKNSDELSTFNYLFTPDGGFRKLEQRITTTTTLPWGETITSTIPSNTFFVVSTLQKTYKFILGSELEQICINSFNHWVKTWKVNSRYESGKRLYRISLGFTNFDQVEEKCNQINGTLLKGISCNEPCPHELIGLFLTYGDNFTFARVATHDHEN